MFGFLKKFFGMDKDTMKAAGVHLEQPAPYKVETPTVVALGEPPATVVVPSTVTLAVEGAGAVEIPAEKPAKKLRAKKAAGEKKPREKRIKKD